MIDRVLGLDGYKKRWLGVTLLDGRFHAAKVFDTIGEALAYEPEATVVAIDVPIGLGDANGRPADHKAKEFLRKRRSSVFLTLPEAVYAAGTHSEAVELARRLTGKGISRQSYGLGPKIREAAATARTDSRLVEVHPEVSFAVLAGAPLESSKKSWNGVMERRRVLAGTGVIIPDALAADAGKASPDDVLDAAAAAWTARRVAQGTANVLPAGATMKQGGVGVIWY